MGTAGRGRIERTFKPEGMQLRGLHFSGCNALLSSIVTNQHCDQPGLSPVCRLSPVTIEQRVNQVKGIPGELNEESEWGGAIYRPVLATTTDVPAGAPVAPGAKVDSGARVLPGARVVTGERVAPGLRVAPGAKVGAGARVLPGARVATGARVAPGLRVAPGAAVTVAG